MVASIIKNAEWWEMKLSNRMEIRGEGVLNFKNHKKWVGWYELGHCPPMFDGERCVN